MRPWSRWRDGTKRSQCLRLLLLLCRPFTPSLVTTHWALSVGLAVILFNLAAMRVDVSVQGAWGVERED